MMDKAQRRARAIELGNEYKDIEERFFKVQPPAQNAYRKRIAEIAGELVDLGYSLSRMIWLRYEREGKEKRIHDN